MSEMLRREQSDKIKLLNAKIYKLQKANRDLQINQTKRILNEESFEKPKLKVAKKETSKPKKQPKKSVDIKN